RRPASRFENGDQTLAFVFHSKRLQGFLDRGRVMRKIVDHRNAALDAADLDAPFHALKSIESFLNFFLRNSPGVRRDDHRETISDVEFADKLCLEFAPTLSFFENRKPRR